MGAAAQALHEQLHGRWGLAPHAAAHAAALLAVHPSLSVSSGYRDAAHNARVGGAPRSYHVRRRAMDFTGPLPLLRAAAVTARAQRITPGCTGPEEVLVEDAGAPNQHLHVSW